MFRKILVPYDLSRPSKPALDAAVKFAGRFKSKLSVLNILMRYELMRDMDVWLQTDDMIRLIRDDIEKDIGRLLRGRGKLKSRDVTVGVVEGKPISEILTYIGRESPDLVFMGTHGRTGLKHVMLGSVAENIIRHSPAPVLVVRGKIKWPPKKILLPVSLAEDSEEVPRLAAQFASQIGARLELVHVVTFAEIGSAYRPRFDVAEGNVADQMRRLVKERMGKILRAYPKLKMGSHVVIGPVAREICAAAKKVKADMIFMPTHGRTGVGHFLIGSVAEQVVRYAPCSVLSYCPAKSRKRREAFIRSLKAKMKK